MKHYLPFTLCVVGVIVVGINARSEAKKEPAKSAAVQPAPDNAKPMPAPDNKGQAELLATLEKVVAEKDVAKLAALAGVIGNDLLAALEYQRGIAKLGQQEILLETARSETMSAAQEASKERKALKSRLDKDLEEIKRQHPADAKLAEVEMVARIQAFRPTLLTLRHQEDEFTKIVRDTSEKLSKVRNEKHRLEREYALVKLGVLQRKVISIPPISPGSFGDDYDTPTRTPATPATKESLQKALDSVKDLGN